MLAGAARRHRAAFETLVAQTGRRVVFRARVGRVSSSTAADRVLGTRAQETGDGTETALTAVFSAGGSVDIARSPQKIAALGNAGALDALLRLPVASALLDVTKPLGRTVAHLAKDVVVDGEVFEIVGIDRSGLPPEPPYILWVGLKKAQE
jgi:hypothetical protein